MVCATISMWLSSSAAMSIKQIFDFRIFDPKTLRHILHGCLQLAIAAAQLFLKQHRILRVGLLDFHCVK